MDKPDYKQLCADLVAWAEKTSAHYYSEPRVLIQARAALAEPEPEGPTDIEIASILKAYAVIEPQMGISRILHEKHFSNAAHAILARLGNHPTSPDSSTPQPIPVTERLPGPLVDSEVAELVEWLNDHAYVLNEHGARIVRRAVDLLKQLPPRPISVTERLPGPEDCVVISWSEIRSPHVWAGKRRLINGPTEIWDWTFASISCLEESGEFTHWLPASASVLPAGAIRQSNPSA